MKPSTQRQASFRFRAENFTRLPNDVLNLVLEGRLKSGAVVTYAYLLAKVAIAKIAFKKPYTAVSIEIMSAELGVSATAVKASLRSLVRAGVIERQDTPGFTRTLILVKVENGKIVRAAPTPRPPKKRPSTEQPSNSEVSEGFDIIPPIAEQDDGLSKNGGIAA